jgi:hypothetical protein
VVVVAMAPTINAEEEKMIVDTWAQAREQEDWLKTLNKEEEEILANIKVTVCSAEKMLEQGRELLVTGLAKNEQGWPRLPRPHLQVSQQLSSNSKRILLIGGRRRIGKSTLVEESCPEAIFIDLNEMDGDPGAGDFWCLHEHCTESLDAVFSSQAALDKHTVNVH